MTPVTPTFYWLTEGPSGIFRVISRLGPGSFKATMSSLNALLIQAEASLADPTPTQREILAKLKEVQARIEEGCLRVAVLGQFKRGKSTLLNALLGTLLLPTGITPVTAIPTFVKSGNKAHVRIEFNDAREPLESFIESEFSGILARFVSEAENPGNRDGVRHVEIAVNSVALSNDIILVDTPGVGSTFRHNTRTAEAVLNDCDVGIFVVSADPPITEVELDYLDKVKRIIPKIFFVLNKVDLLDDAERSIAKAFLAKVLGEKPDLARPHRIFNVSAKQALAAKQIGDFSALAASGVVELERTLADDLANEKRAIVLATSRSRSTLLVGELLYHCELEHKSLLLPEQELRRKLFEFERSVARLESDRRDLSDYISVDRNRLLASLDEMTDKLWNEARAKFMNMATMDSEQPFNEHEARDRIGKALEQYFEAASGLTIDRARGELVSRVASHQAKAGALIGHIRQTAADLMEISVNLPPPEHAFELKREPYWVAPATSNSILDTSLLNLTRMYPRKIRERRLSRHIVADTERAVLRNIANLDWALRQNIEDAFRGFEASLTDQLFRASEETRQAMEIALQKRSARSAEVGAFIAESQRSAAVLKSVLDELRVANSL
jgi:small GTP-binding protein